MNDTPVTNTAAPDTRLPNAHLPNAPEHGLILLVEDDAKIADMVANYLHMHGYRTHTLGDGAVALAWLQNAGQDGAGHGVAAQAEFPALVLLDLMLPGLDGVALCRALRQFSAVPVIMVTARVDEADRLTGLDIGADDYVCKPFSPRELVARIKALLRRTERKMMTGLPKETVSAPVSLSRSSSYASPPPRQFSVDVPQFEISYAGQALNLTPVEFRLFERLLKYPGRVLARAQLLDAVHADFRDVSDRAVDSHIKNLRRKIDAVHPTLHATGAGIITVYGVGYRFTP